MRAASAGRQEEQADTLLRFSRPRTPDLGVRHPTPTEKHCGVAVRATGSSSQSYAASTVKSGATQSSSRRPLLPVRNVSPNWGPDSTERKEVNGNPNLDEPGERERDPDPALRRMLSHARPGPSGRRSPGMVHFQHAISQMGMSSFDGEKLTRIFPFHIRIVDNEKVDYRDRSTI